MNWLRETFGPDVGPDDYVNVDCVDPADLGEFIQWATKFNVSYRLPKWEPENKWFRVEWAPNPLVLARLSK